MDVSQWPLIRAGCNKRKCILLSGSLSAFPFIQGILGLLIIFTLASLPVLTKHPRQGQQTLFSDLVIIRKSQAVPRINAGSVFFITTMSVIVVKIIPQRKTAKLTNV